MMINFSTSPLIKFFFFSRKLLCCQREHRCGRQILVLISPSKSVTNNTNLNKNSVLVVCISFLQLCDKLFQIQQRKDTYLFSHSFLGSRVQVQFSCFFLVLKDCSLGVTQGCHSHLKLTVLSQVYVDVGRIPFFAVIGLEPSAPEVISFYRQFTTWLFAFFKVTRRIFLMLRPLLRTSPNQGKSIEQNPSLDRLKVS